MRDRRFPIYRADLFWPETGKDGERVQNSGGGECMFEREQTPAELAEWTAKLWDHYRAEATDPGRPVIETRFVRWDTWVLRWFGHTTIDTGQTDDEALSSFQEYVWRVSDWNRANRDAERCLMGAEDRWRWYGNNDENGDQHPAPCRCDGCKKNGVLLICH